MKITYEKHAQRGAEVCSFCGGVVKDDYRSVVEGVIICSKCYEQVIRFLGKMRKGEEFGYITTDGKQGVFTVR